VGAIGLQDLQAALGKDNVEFLSTNDNIKDSKVLNFECGADFVKMKQTSPKGVSLAVGNRSCSLDGDADRIVFYFGNEEGKFFLLDGDKIATLAAQFIMKEIKEANVKLEDGSELKVGVVQTAYANGSATSYVKNVLV
jgi:phosphoacetylglucosamine mutase